MCSGASHEILSRQEFASERSKYIGIGATVFSTGLLSALSASYALHLALPSVAISIVFGLLYGLLIFNLDRYVVLTLKRKRVPANFPLAERIKRMSGEISVALPRLLFTIFISLIIAFPVELKLFEKEIDGKIKERQLSELFVIRNRLLEQSPEINALEVENERLKREIETKQKQTNDLQQSLLNQLRQSSNNYLLSEQRSALLKSEIELDELKKANQERINANYKRLEYLRSEIEAQVTEARVSRSYGLLARLEALNDLKSHNETIALVSIFIIILFILLLTSPIFMKLLSDTGPYEQFWEALESMAYNNEQNNLSLNSNTDEGTSSSQEGIREQRRSHIQQEDKAIENISQINELASHRRLRVFLCHSSNDKPAIRELYKRLSVDDIEPWLDEEDILPGQDWNQEITNAVKNCDAVMVCLSRGASTKTGFLQKEIRFALEVAAEQPDGAIFLIPTKLEECDVPDALRRLQWVNLFEDNGYKRLMRALHNRALAVGVIIGA
ncbi:MAG: hypothetical protein AUG51_10075 [Acidobacteria bacterium 13_1_20CM_3_53_8]|nr:MAG: hypothetical protein AUG51_10075 [Acidobacteria bacterium 13_1_20CM_3_53_8]